MEMRVKNLKRMTVTQLDNSKARLWAPVFLAPRSWSNPPLLASDSTLLTNQEILSKLLLKSEAASFDKGNVYHSQG